MTRLLSLTGVGVTHHRRGESVTALTDVSLTVAAGTSLAIIGPSGSGKTTLLDVMVGWRAPDAGAIERASVIPDGWAGVAIVPQALGLLEELTIDQNIAVTRHLGHRPAVEPEAVADALGIRDLGDRLPGETSLGEQQRAAVARAVVPGPMVVLADEPTAHQDEANALLVASYLRSVAAGGGAVVVATHDERILDGFDRVVRLDDGRLSAGR